MWSFDFTDALLLPYIVSVTYSIEVAGSVFVQHVSRPPVGLTVNVETNILVDATVYITVDQVWDAMLLLSDVCVIMITRIIINPQITTMIIIILIIR
jgi:hypothetical protein